MTLRASGPKAAPAISLRACISCVPLTAAYSPLYHSIQQLSVNLEAILISPLKRSYQLDTRYQTDITRRPSRIGAGWCSVGARARRTHNPVYLPPGPARLRAHVPSPYRACGYGHSGPQNSGVPDLALTPEA